MDTDLSPTAFFSPSKARAQRSQARDWERVTNWLTAHYGDTKIPPFERNETTLKALLDLAAANEKADEEQKLVNSVKQEALSELTARQDVIEKQGEGDEVPAGRTNAEILDALEAGLTDEGKRSLDVLAELAVAADAVDARPASIAEALTSHALLAASQSIQVADLEAALESLDPLSASLDADMQVLTIASSVQRSEDEATQAETWTQQTKHLREKTAEYADRLASGSSSSESRLPSKGQEGEGQVSAVRVLEQEERVRAMKARVEGLERRVSLFEGLRGGKDEARQKVREAELELERLQGRMNELVKKSRAQ